MKRKKRKDYVIVETVEPYKPRSSKDWFEIITGIRM